MSLYQKLSFEQQQKLEQILHFFDLKEDKNKKLNTLSLGNKDWHFWQEPSLKIQNY
jgi:molybdate transport system ATP-binding protein